MKTKMPWYCHPFNWIYLGLSVVANAVDYVALKSAEVGCALATAAQRRACNKYGHAPLSLEDESPCGFNNQAWCINCGDRMVPGPGEAF